MFINAIFYLCYFFLTEDFVIFNLFFHFFTHVGEVQEGDSHGAQQQQLHYTMQQASIGDGFTTRFRKITRATRKYRGIPDGRVQIKLFDLGFCGGGMSLTGEMGKKRKVEREPELRNTRFKLSGT